MTVKSNAGTTAAGNANGESEVVEQVQSVKTEAATSKSGQTIAEVVGVKVNENGEENENGSQTNKPPKKENRSSLFNDFMDTKKENREIKRMLREEVIPTIKALQEQAGNSGNAPTGKLDALAKKWDLEPEFVKELATTIKGETGSTDSETLEKVLTEMQELKEGRKDDEKKITSAQISTAIDNELDRVIAENPEIGKVANKAAVKKFILSNKENLEKKMEDILEEIYGNAISGKPGMDGYSGQGGGRGGNTDDTNTTTPTDEDHAKIRKNPILFKEYQDNLINRLQNPSGRVRNR